MLQTMTRNISTRLKLNGVCGPPIQQTSGVRQGCPLSSLIFLMVMEVVLTMIREAQQGPDATIRGIEIPGADGDDSDGHRATVCERSLADDLAVYVSDLETSIPALRALLARFRRMSGQRIKLEKSATVLLGVDA